MSLLNDVTNKAKSSVPKVPKVPSVDSIKGKVSGPLSKGKDMLNGKIGDLKDKIPGMPDLPDLGTAKIKGGGPPAEPKQMGAKYELDNFISIGAISKGLHYQHNFVVYFDQPAGFTHDIKPENLTWNAIEVAVPGIVLGISDLKINGRPRYFAAERAEQDLKITFLEDKDMSCRRFFEEWMSIIYNPYDKGRNYPDDFKAHSIKIHTTNQNGISSYCDTFMDIFPFDISDMNYSTSTYGVSKTSVSFKFKAHILEGPTDNNQITTKVNLF